MDTITLKPDQKYFTKDIIVYLTISFVIILLALPIQIIVPLADESVSFGQIAIYLWPITLGIIALMLLIGIPLSKIYFNNLEYYIEEDRIKINKGIIGRYQQNIPLHMVTDFMLSRTIYDRWLGIASINVQTAGQTMNTTGYEGTLGGLLDWDSLMAELRKRTKSVQKDENTEMLRDKPQETSGQYAELLEEVKKIRTLLEKR